jgi:adenylosuccinate lyase
VVEARALARLGLQPETVATQIVARDRHAEYFASLAVAGAAVERLALTVRHWQRTEVGEAQEPFGRGQKGSSAMPHKKNPILSENLCGLARLLRAYAGAALEDIALWHERDISHSSVERVAGPDASVLCDFMLDRAAGLVEGLSFDVQAAAANLERTRGLIYSEAALLALVRAGMARQQAYEVVQRAAMRVLEGAAPSFREALGGDPEVARRLDVRALDACFDLAHHLRHVDAIFRRCFGPEGAA